MLDLCKIDPAADWTTEEEEGLALLMAKLKQKKGWVPDKVLLPTHQAINFYAIEIILEKWKWNDDCWGILLSVYEGGVKEFQGLWHIPGAYTKEGETLKETAAKAGIRELGSPVQIVKVIEDQKWPPGVHPWGGRPISSFTLCEAEREIEETDNRRFFTLSELPPPEEMVPVHPEFLDWYLNGGRG